MVQPYICIETSAPDDTPCNGCGCDWQGTLAEVGDIDDCTLDSGDASPAGRCPKCGDLVYLDRPIDRIRDHATDFAAVAALLIFGGGDNASIQQALDLANAALKACDLHSREALTAAKIPFSVPSKEA